MTTPDEQHDAIVAALLAEREPGRTLADLKPWARGKLHNEANAVLNALGIGAVPRSYPDTITNPADPPTVEGTDITRQI